MNLKFLFSLIFFHDHLLEKKKLHIYIKKLTNILTELLCSHQLEVMV